MSDEIALGATNVQKLITIVRQKARLSGDRDHAALADVCESLIKRIAELKAGLIGFRDAWENATSGFDGLSQASCDNLDAASQVAAELLTKKELK